MADVSMIVLEGVPKVGLGMNLYISVAEIK